MHGLSDLFSFLPLGSSLHIGNRPQTSPHAVKREQAGPPASSQPHSALGVEASILRVLH